MRILVRGGAGCIGPHVPDGTPGVGHPVAAVDELSTGSTQHVASDHPR